MSLDSSLKTEGKLTGTRSVLTRAERIAQLKKDKQMETTAKKGALGIRKTRIKGV